MATAPATEQPQDEGLSQSVFHRVLRARRTAVARRIDRRLDTPQVAGLVFDLLVHLALNPDAEVDSTLVQSFARRHRLSLEQARLAIGDERTRPLLDCLADPGDPAAVDTINAYFSRGFAEKLSPLRPADRRAFAVRIVGLLPGIERIGPYALTDYLDDVCSEEDALRFWQVYVERVGAEVSKRTRQPAGPPAPWVFSSLLDIHEGRDEAPAPSRAWLALKRHVARVLETDRHRWRFIRALAESCNEPRMLHYICTSPAMVEDVELLHVFLTRGDSRLVSCALFALQINGELDVVVGRLLEFLRTRPLPEIGERLVEIYAQVHLPVRPSLNLRRLALGLRSLTGQRVIDGAVDNLLHAVRGDARALRQCLLLADLSTDPAVVSTAQGKRLIERVVTTFYQAFTPSGITHPLHDAVFRGAVRRSIRTLMAAELPRLRDRLENFGLELEEHVDRWCRDDTPEAARRSLFARFASVYADVIGGASRALFAAPATRDAGRLLYQSLIRVYLEHREALEGLAAFGAVEHALPTLYPELVRVSPDDVELGRLIDAAHTIAEIEQAYGAGEEDGALRPLEDDGPVGISPLVARKPDREKPLTAPVRILSRRPTGTGSVLRAYLGLDLLTFVRERAWRLMGMRHRGELRLTDRELIVTGQRTLGGRVVERSGDSHALDDLLAVHVRQRIRLFYVVLGLLGLVTGGLLGGHLLFVGLRGGDTTTALLGAGGVALGVLFDAALSRVAEARKRAVILELECKSRPRHFTLELDIDQGAEVLDAFMANDAERRELKLLETWSEVDVRWEPLDEPG